MTRSIEMSRDYRPDEFLEPREPWTAPAQDPPESARAEPARDRVADHTSSDQDRTPPDGRTPREQDPPAERRKRYEFREQTYRLRSSEVRTLVELGKFRTVSSRDLRKYAYGQERNLLKPDLSNLLRQGLIAAKIVPHEDASPRQLLTLTKSGYEFIANTGLVPSDQALYYGFTKPREALHDADLYRLYQKAARQITERGGKNLRVVLDYEFRKRLYQELGKAGPDQNSTERKRQVAEQHDLRVVRGKIPLPDLRIEYETPDGDLSRLDLELATAHYRGSNVVEKVRAGFAIYANAQDVPGLRRIMDQRQLSAEILSL
jgi:hypothetical protein